MSHARFRDTGEGSFFGNLVYERAVPKGHFLRQLRELLDWEALTQDWVALYKGGAEYGPPPYLRPVVGAEAAAADLPVQSLRAAGGALCE